MHISLRINFPQENILHVDPASHLCFLIITILCFSLTVTDNISNMINEARKNVYIMFFTASLVARDFINTKTEIRLSGRIEINKA